MQKRSRTHGKTYSIKDVIAILLVIFLIFGGELVFVLQKKAKKETYTIYKIVHYQAYNAEEINQVWLKDKDGSYFYIMVNDKEYFELQTKDSDGTPIMSLSKNDLEKMLSSK